MIVKKKSNHLPIVNRNIKPNKDISSLKGSKLKPKQSRDAKTSMKTLKIKIDI